MPEHTPMKRPLNDMPLIGDATQASAKWCARIVV
jgi:hypothetical protein